MGYAVRKTVVISAVNIRKGGTLTILRDCLRSASALCPDCRVIALVHDRSLCDFPGIEYVEMPDTVKSWSRRLWCEYVTMRKLSLKFGPVHVWLSLHDTTPRVKAEHRAVYCQTSFPFLKPKIQDLVFDPKIFLFTLFTRFAYRVGVHSNDYLISQTGWFRAGLSEMLSFPSEKIIVFPPERSSSVLDPSVHVKPQFIFPATPDCHKNFEVLCEAARLLEAELGKGRFKVVLTINGTENRYSRWIRRKWGAVESIDFHGFVSREALVALYSESAALVFPSRVETWGLPISEYSSLQRPMILADLPYAHETASGCSAVSFFNPDDPKALASRMKAVLDADLSLFSDVSQTVAESPSVEDWRSLFGLLGV